MTANCNNNYFTAPKCCVPGGEWVGPGGRVEAVELGEGLAQPRHDVFDALRRSLPLLRASGLFGKLLLVVVPGRDHRPLLLLPGDLDEGLAPHAGVGAAIVPDC